MTPDNISFPTNPESGPLFAADSGGGALFPEDMAPSAPAVSRSSSVPVGGGLTPVERGIKSEKPAFVPSPAADEASLLAPAAPNLLDGLNAWSREVEAFHLAPPDKLASFDHALDEARRGRLDLPPPPTLTVLLLGASGAGKSELLNALAGDRIAASHHVRPTTRRPTIYAHASLPPERLYDYGPILGDLAKAPGAFRTHQREELRHKILIDAPDIDSYETGHRDLVLDLLPAVDVALYVTTPYNYKDDVGWQVVLKERGRRAFAFVLNKWDADGKPPVAAGAPDVDDDLRTLLAKGGWATPLVFRTSARYWTEHRIGAGPSIAATGSPASVSVRQNGIGTADLSPDGDQLPDLEGWLAAGLSTSHVEQIQRRRRRSLWGALAAASSSALPADLAASGWNSAAQADVAQLVSEAWGLLQPPLAARAAALAAVADRSGRFETPGPFGIAQRSFAGLAGFARGANRMRQPFALPSAAASSLAVDGTSSSHALSQAAASVTLPSLASYLARRIDRLEWRAREVRLPIDWISEQWRSSLGTIDSSLGDAADTAAAELGSRQRARGRRHAAAVATVIAEVSMVAVLILAAWRLATGFLVGRYLDIGFLGNLLALLLCVYFLGQFIVGMLQPHSESAFRRELESRVGRAWDDQAKQFLITPLKQFLSAYERLRSHGVELVRRCGDETQRLTNQIAASGEAEASATDQLFGHPGAATLEPGTAGVPASV